MISFSFLLLIRGGGKAWHSLNIIMIIISKLLYCANYSWFVQMRIYNTLNDIIDTNKTNSSLLIED